MKLRVVLAGLFVAAGLAAIGSLAIADASKDAQTPASLPPDFKLPEGWTMEDMQACIIAGTPGEKHKMLMKDAGEWDAKTTMWMAEGSPPMTSDGAMTVTPIMDGRYMRSEMKGEMPGMGPYNGFGLYGFDNVSQKFVAVWIDNHSTGIMNGTGQMSDDGQTMTWNYTFNCPVTKKPAKMREVDTTTGPNTKRMEMYGVDPKSGKEYKMMSIDFTRKA